MAATEDTEVVREEILPGKSVGNMEIEKAALGISTFCITSEADDLVSGNRGQAQLPRPPSHTDRTVATWDHSRTAAIPPQELPRRASTLYFAVDPHHDQWALVEKGRNIALYWDNASEDLEIELMVVSRS